MLLFKLLIILKIQCDLNCTIKDLFCVLQSRTGKNWPHWILCPLPKQRYWPSTYQQNTSGTANNAKVAAGVTVTSTTSTKSLPVAIVTSTTGDVGVQSNAAFSYQPSTGTLTVSKVAITSINLGGCVISFNTDDGTVNFADAESGKSATITLTGKK